jgi:hypothetical protein
MEVVCHKPAIIDPPLILMCSHDCDKSSDCRAPGADNCHCCGGADRVGNFDLGALAVVARLMT